MIKKMIKKSDYIPIQKKSDNKYLLMWGYTPVMEKEYQRDEEGNIVLDDEKKPVVVSEKETDYCIVCNEILMLPKNWNNIVSIINKGKAVGYDTPSMEEWAEWTKMFVSESLQIKFLKERLKEKIICYDKSKNVEDFSIGGIHMWLNSNLRAKVRENLETAQQKGEENVVLRNEGMAFPMTTTMGWQLYYSVLDYARATWNVTQIHLAESDKLTTLDDILAYDYTSGYPAKLSF